MQVIDALAMFGPSSFNITVRENLNITLSGSLYLEFTIDPVTNPATPMDSLDIQSSVYIFTGTPTYRIFNYPNMENLPIAF